MTTLDNSNLIFGFNVACDATKLTLGGEGKIAMIEGHLGTVSATKDGVSVCKSIFFNDEDEVIRKEKQMGANLAKQVAVKTVTEAGDNTTSSLVFAQALVKKSLEAKDLSTPREIIEGVDRAMTDVISELNNLAEDADKDNLKDIAYISSNGDKEISEMLIEAFDNANIVDVIEADSPTTTMKVIKGMNIEKGYVSPFLTTKESNLTFDETDVEIVIFENSLGLSNSNLVDGIITNSSSPLLLIVEDISEDALNAIVNIHRRGRHICVIKAPEFGQERKQLLQDIAFYTGAEVFVPGVSKVIHAGTADKVIVSKDRTYIIQRELNEKSLEHLSSLKQVEEKTDFIEKRIANLENGVATIYVGGKTDSERKEKFDRFDDAKRALECAVEEGFVAGGGATMLSIAKKLSGKNKKDLGYQILLDTICEPFRQILTNGDVEAEKAIRQINRYGQLYDIKTKKVVNYRKSGIIDAKKSLRVALENAVSVAKLIINTRIISVV